MTKKKADIPEAVFDYCIDNKVSIEEGIEKTINWFKNNIKGTK